MVFSIFSKLLGPGRQGVWMGVITAAGCLARTVGPLFITNVYQDYGPRYTYLVVASMLVWVCV